METRQQLFKLVEMERARQDAKWGEQNHPATFWLAIATEELGEAAKAILQRQPAKVAIELIQLMAVIIAWLESTIPDGNAVEFERYFQMEHELIGGKKQQ